MARIMMLLAMLLAATPALADDGPAYGPQLEGFDYPWPVKHHRFTSQGVAMDMAYMDVAPASAANGHTIVMLHGKNFCGATWEISIAAMSRAGYRVIAPDQIGFCKSTKPAHYQYTFQQLAANTHDLLVAAGVQRTIMMGHSTGGMLAVRYGLMFPDATERLVLVDPIGLEDWKVKGVPWQSVDTWYKHDLRTTADGIRAYERSTYYAGTWNAEYEKWVQMLAGLYRGPGRDIVAWNSALLDDMIFTQPVLYEFGELRMPVLLVIGDKDTSALGKDVAPPAVLAKIGNYPVLGKEAVARFRDGKLIEFPNVGHSPQLQIPDQFHKAVLDWLATAR